MLNILSVSMAVLAVSAPVVAMPTALEPRTTSGCTVDLNSTLTSPAASAEIITTSTMKKWSNATSMDSFDSSYCDWSNTIKAPFSVVFKADTIPGYLTVDELSAVLTPWVGTWLISDGNGSARTGVTGDYNVTSVTCA